MAVKTYITHLLITGSLLLAPTLAAPISAAPPGHPLFNSTTPGPLSSKLPEDMLSECYSSCWSSQNQDPAEAVHCLRTCEERHKVSPVGFPPTHPADPPSSLPAISDTTPVTPPHHRTVRKPLGQVPPHKKRSADIDISINTSVPSPPEVNADGEAPATATASANASTNRSGPSEKCAAACARPGASLCTTAVPDHAGCMETCPQRYSDRVLDCARGVFNAKSTEAEVDRRRQLTPPGLFDPDLGNPAWPGSAPGEIAPLGSEMLAWFQSLPEWQGLAEGETWPPGDAEEEDTTADGEADAPAASRRS